MSGVNEIRSAFLNYFAKNGHEIVPSSPLVPRNDPTLMFTNAGMVQFKNVFTGIEKRPYQRATSSQKCVRAGGKHNDLDNVGYTARHHTFFEMLGNFSFGDYFKERAIELAWNLITKDYAIAKDRLLVTVYSEDEEAAKLWKKIAGLPDSKIIRIGTSDNFWQMGDTGPCGPCSELHIDRGPAFGPEGGPLHDPHGDRFMEFWNLVFMQFNQTSDGIRTPLPKPSIDTGAGLERILALVQGKDSVWETDVMAPLIEQAQSVTGRLYVPGDYEDRSSFSLRVLAEHARSSTMLVTDGVFPSNEGRGYVLRRIIRRAVRHAYLLGTEKLVMPGLVETAIDVMGEAYPDVVKNRDFIVGVLTKEEERFRETLKNGLSILEDELAKGPEVLAGNTAFTLHDTYGFPLELTEEIAGERGVSIDKDGFDTDMAQQRRRAKAGRKANTTGDEQMDSYREVNEQFGITEFLGYVENQTESRILAVLAAADDTVEIFLDRTPFYAESGGQVGDTGTITTETGVADVIDTTFALAGLRRHTARVAAGTLTPGQTATAAIDIERRDAIRRNHTGTHVLHHALRTVLGQHVKQAGSLVGPDRLRFDFSHYSALTDDEITEIERIANREVLANAPARVFETTKQEAMALGAIAFFGDKYGEIVRVLEAGSSVELCGGTHVRATGDIGLIKIVGESSIGSNLRRIEAVTGAKSVALLQRDERLIADSARLLGVPATDVLEGLQRQLEEIKSLNDEIKGLRSTVATGRAGELATKAQGGVLVTRVDGLAPGDLRELALAIRRQPGIRAVVLGGLTSSGGVSSGGVSLVAAVTPEFGGHAGDLIKDAARAVGGGGGGKGDVATAGGKNPDGLDEALRLATEAATSG